MLPEERRPAEREAFTLWERATGCQRRSTTGCAVLCRSVSVACQLLPRMTLA